MNTEYCKITGDSQADEAVIARAAEVIRHGGLVAIPTETVYGLAGSALLDDSAKKIYAAKGRPADNPLIVHIAYPEEAERIAYPDELYGELAKRFMPGPLTVVLKKRSVIPDTVTAGGDTVAVRCPSNSVAHRLIEVSGHPIAAPSANRSGAPSPTTAEHVRADMDGKIDMILDGGPCEIGLESTVIRLDGDGACTILRPGAVTAEMLGEVCREVRIAPAVIEPALAEAIRPESPGMKYKHYAPRANLVLIDASHETFVKYVRSHASGKYGVLSSNEDAGAFTGGMALLLGPRGNAKEAAKRLFSLLRRADEAELETVYAELPPAEGETLAYYNRIIRAAGCRIVKPGKE
ncbi:MAG: threonylcarbamoyl-AMP synthase [Clostridia bacterium]|nr:threonylcarbamoyl-AMP synthase [Clostridia bacterium]MBR5366152.1 threonylcarbamoyl-AMP synthase [Clostridia bacterium]